MTDLSIYSGLLGYEYDAVECSSLQEEGNAWSRDVFDSESSNETLGTCLTMPLKIQAMSLVQRDQITKQALTIGSINTTYNHGMNKSTTEIAAIEQNKRFMATNLDWQSVLNCLVSALTTDCSPFFASTPTSFSQRDAVVAFLIGAGGAARAAMYAFEQMQINTVFVVNRDTSELDALVQDWKGKLRVRAIESIDEVDNMLQGKRLAVAVACIPSESMPITLNEHRVYDIAKRLFEQQILSFNSSPAESTKSEHVLQLPNSPVLLDMAYKPPMTPLRTIAESFGWKTICGAEAVLEVCFEQCQLWLNQPISRQIRDGARQLVRSRINYNKTD
ncbi:hypothetical protein OIO90_004169 [Microbotryomycetes sp. JL221]|nr:hypothetical protein OIO90_004169 [Microbotryomycetes sp. JL221]